MSFFERSYYHHEINSHASDSTTQTNWNFLTCSVCHHLQYWHNLGWFNGMVKYWMPNMIEKSVSDSFKPLCHKFLTNDTDRKSLNSPSLVMPQCVTDCSFWRWVGQNYSLCEGQYLCWWAARKLGWRRIHAWIKSDLHVEDLTQPLTNINAWRGSEGSRERTALILHLLAWYAVIAQWANTQLQMFSVILE